MLRSARVARTAGRLRWPAWSGMVSTWAPRSVRAAILELGAVLLQRIEEGASLLSAERTSCEVRGMRRWVSRMTRRSGRRRGRLSGPEESAAVGELGVVGEDGADAGEDGVGGVAEELDLVAGGGAGEPVGLVGEARGWWWGEFAVDGEGGFEGDEGRAVLDEVGEGIVEVAGLLLEGRRG